VNNPVRRHAGLPVESLLTSTNSPAGRNDASGLHKSGAWLPCLIGCLWIALAALLNRSQFVDNLEQFVWAHGLEWGYWKHPPLPSALFATWQALFGPSRYTAYVLAALCFCATAWLLWRIAVHLLGERWGMAAAILFGLQLGFSWRAQIFNHNTVLLAFCAATVWAAMRAAQRRDLRWWAMTGGLAGLAMLSKYQAMVIFLGLLVGLWRTGQFAAKPNRWGLALGILVALAVFAPHLGWLIETEFLPLTYATRSLQGESPGRARVLASFMAAELRSLVPVLVCLALCALLAARGRIAQAGAHAPPLDAASMRWLQALVGVPVLFVVALGLFGVRLEGHWTLQTFLFLPIALAVLARRWWPALPLPRFIACALLVHAITMAAYVAGALRLPAGAIEAGNDRSYPAEQLARQVAGDWQRATGCPLAYLVGPSFEAGMVSVYSGLFVPVLEVNDPRKSPWLDLADMKRRGSVYVGPPHTLPPGYRPLGSILFPHKRGAAGEGTQVHWGYRSPAVPCD
jgi:4-amino-4-deoxy-L-arabinose transferase-like glycosyltransferase